MTRFAAAHRLLDQIQRLSELDAFDPARFAGALGETPAGRPDLAGMGGELDAARDLLAAIDRFAEKAMRIRLQHADALPAQLRLLFATTILSYERDPLLLRERVSATLSRLDRATATALTEDLCDSAAQALAIRAALRNAVVAHTQRAAAAWLPTATNESRDRTLPDDDRDRWRRARADLEQVAARGETVAAGSFAERLARATPPPPEPAPEEPEVDPTSKRFSLLELD